ncbi:hypothetical protein NQZ68_000892 [Dissostichus eleginoides]|nr:hypothetical protein NQZ68_000892 [Dissostichus eleginoides]
MAELGSTSSTGPTSSTGRKRKTFMEQIKNKKKAETRRSQTRVNIGVAFQRWRLLMEHTELKSDAMVALFLLDSYEKDVSSSTPLKPGLPRPPPPAVSTISSEELSDRDEQFSVESIEEMDNSAQETALRELDASMSSQDLHIGLINADEFNDIQNSTIDWEDDSWCPDKETESASSLEEDETREVDSNSDNSEDEDYVPRICVR